MKPENYLLDEARLSLTKESDLSVKCLDGTTKTSRLLFGLVLKPELQKELYSDPDSYFVVPDIRQSDLEQLLQNIYFNSGRICGDPTDAFPFVNWSLFAAAKAHPAEKFECSICGKILSDKKNLKKHADVVHFNIRNYNCDTCGKRFIARNDLQDHVRAVHQKIKAFICDVCGQALSTRHGLRMHKLIHKEDSKSILCPRCEKSFRHLSTYRKHMARVHELTPEKRLKCSEGCGKMFNHSEGLKRHVKKFHSLEKPQYQCSLCPLSFVFNYDLNKHLKRVH